MRVTCHLFFAAVTAVLLTGCLHAARYVLTDDLSAAVTLAARPVEEMLAREKAGKPPPAESWCAYWRLRQTGLRQAVTQGSDFAEPSRLLLAYIRRRRAQEGLPPCDRPLVLIFHPGARGVATEPEDAPAAARRSVEGLPRGR